MCNQEKVWAVAWIQLTDGRDTRRPPTDTTCAGGAAGSFANPPSLRRSLPKAVSTPLPLIRTGMSRLHLHFVYQGCARCNVADTVPTYKLYQQRTLGGGKSSAGSLI